MHVTKSHEPVYVEVTQMVLNLMLTYDGRDFVPLVPTRDGVQRLERYGKSDYQLKFRQKNTVEYLSLLNVDCH